MESKKIWKNRVGNFGEVRRQEGSKSFRQVGSVQLRSPQAMQTTFVEKSSQRGYLSRVTLFHSMLKDLFGPLTPSIRKKWKGAAAGEGRGFVVVFVIVIVIEVEVEAVVDHLTIALGGD